MWRMRYCASFSGEKCTHLPLPVAIATITIKMHGGIMEELITATQGWGRMVWWGFCFLVMWPNMPTFWSCCPYWYKSLAWNCFIQLQFLHSLINRLETWWVGAQWSHLTIFTIFKVKGHQIWVKISVFEVSAIGMPRNKVPIWNLYRHIQ